MTKLLIVLGALAFGVAASLGITWVMWKLWLWVLPQVYPGGPDAIVAPGFWLFFAAWVLIGFAGRSVFGGSRSKA